MVSSFHVENVECLDLARSSFPIATGVGFLDHMLDQFNSHAQVGVAISISSGHATTTDDRNRHASLSQETLQHVVGTAMGEKLRALLVHVPQGASSRFCCPLDEALVECTVTKGTGRLVEFSLAPYGIYPKPSGRTKVGQMETCYIETFMSSLAQGCGLDVKLLKIRGDNGHHVVESAFKALSRAFRNLVDGTNTSNAQSPSDAMQDIWGIKSDSHAQSLQLHRRGKVERKTKETSILVQLFLDGGVKGVFVETGIATLNEFWALFASEANMSLTVECTGDLWVDDHHTSEDVAIAVGQVLNQALGTKAGLNRMWCAEGQYHDASVEVTMDLSNRPCLTHNLTLAECGEEYVGGDSLTVEMMDHVLESFVMNSHMTVHIVEQRAGETVKDTAFATAIAFGRALRFCSAVDPRRAGKTASSKGTLSV